MTLPFSILPPSNALFQFLDCGNLINLQPNRIRPTFYGVSSIDVIAKFRNARPSVGTANIVCSTADCLFLFTYLTISSSNRQGFQCNTVQLGYIGLGYIGFRIYRIKFLAPIAQNNRRSLVYIGFRIYRINFAVHRDQIYPSSAELFDVVQLDLDIRMPGDSDLNL